MQIRKIVSADLSQLLELAREVREHYREVLNGYFTPQDDNKDKYDGEINKEPQLKLRFFVYGCQFKALMIKRRHFSMERCRLSFSRRP